MSLDCRDFLGVVGATGSFSGVMSLCLALLGSVGVENSSSSYLTDFLFFLSDFLMGDLSDCNETDFLSLFRPIFSEHRKHCKNPSSNAV